MKTHFASKAIHSDAKKLRLYRGRKARRQEFFVSDIEPQSKKMRDAERASFQSSLLQTMDRRGWPHDIVARYRIAVDLDLPIWIPGGTQ
jgi:hypothetical protein